VDSGGGTILSLPESFFLICINNEDHSVKKKLGGLFDFGLSAAVLSEMLLKDYISLVDKLAVTFDDKKTGEDLYDFFLEKIHAEKKIHSLKYWIKKASKKRKFIQNEVTAGLEGKNIIESIGKKEYTIKNTAIVQNIYKNIRISLQKSTSIDERSVILLSLAKSCKLLKDILGRDEKQELKEDIKDIIKTDFFSNKLSEILQELEELED